MDYPTTFLVVVETKGLLPKDIRLSLCEALHDAMETTCDALGISTSEVKVLTPGVDQ